jgi:hypothetical protein
MTLQQEYERPPINKRPSVTKPPPGGPRGDPEEGGKRYQHVQEIVGALRAQFFRSEFMHIGFQWILDVSRIGSLEIGGRGSVRRRGLINFCPKSVATHSGRGGFINRRSPVKAMHFSGPRWGPETPPNVSGLLCNYFWWG